jgi:hypothetical protein
MVDIETVLLHETRQAGDTYVMGSVVSFNGPDPKVVDYSGLVQWSCRTAGVTPDLPRSSWQRAQYCSKCRTPGDRSNRQPRALDWPKP